MKHLLSGVAIAAALAIAAPVWAQAPAADSPTTAAPPAAAPMAPMAGKQRHKRMMRRHMAKHRAMRSMRSGDNMTDQLNREELARIQGGAMPAAPPQALQGPKVSGGASGR